jgi:hypothetical protein
VAIDANLVALVAVIVTGLTTIITPLAVGLRDRAQWRREQQAAARGRLDRAATVLLRRLAYFPAASDSPDAGAPPVGAGPYLEVLTAYYCWQLVAAETSTPADQGRLAVLRETLEREGNLPSNLRFTAPGLVGEVQALTQQARARIGGRVK